MSTLPAEPARAARTPRAGVVLHPSAFAADAVSAAVGERASFTPYEAGEALAGLAAIPDGAVAVVLLDSAALAALPGQGPALPGDGSRVAFIALADDAGAALAQQHDFFLVMPAGAPPAALGRAVARALDYLAQLQDNLTLVRSIAEQSRDLEELHAIGIALSTEREPERLLSLILQKARALSNADAGSLYLVEEGPEGTPQLRFKMAQNDSLDVPYTEFTLPLSKKSLAGYVAVTGQSLMIDDSYRIPAEAEYGFNRSFDQRVGYRSKSQLVVPMADHRGQIIGVLQLINRKRQRGVRLASPEDAEREVVDFDDKTAVMMRSLASQAAVSLENSRLIESIEKLFEGFVFASVTAIEQRDPTTSGHSSRVAALTCRLAELVDRTSGGPYGGISFDRDQMKEIRYASILHDFGKIGVREQVLVKAKKLYEGHLEGVRARFAFIYRGKQLEWERRKIDYLLQMGRRDYTDAFARFDEQMERQLAELDAMLARVVESNEPSVLPAGNFEAILRIAENSYEDLQGGRHPYLSEQEVNILSIRKGSLDERERLEIESHVTHTFRFLSKIPWTSELKRIPQIAYSHHEKLNGRGYPNKLTQVEIPIQSRMMTITDIYDALSASDRPYKRAVPIDKAIDILRAEAKDGLVEADLVEMFAEGKVWEAARS